MMVFLRFSCGNYLLSVQIKQRTTLMVIIVIVIIILVAIPSRNESK